MATIPNQTHTQGQNGTQTTPGTARLQELSAPRAPSLFDRHFTKPGVSPYDEITWELRDAIIQDFKGKIIFEQKNVEVPADWSMTATNIVASKYLHGQIGTPEREIRRPRPHHPRRRVHPRLGHRRRLLRHRRKTPPPSTTSSPTCSLNQKVAFNSPVWFNVGCDRLEPNSDAQNWHWNPHTGEVEFSVTGYSQAAVLRLLHQLRATTRSTPS